MSSRTDLYRHRKVNGALLRFRRSRPFTLGGGSEAVTDYPVKLVIGLGNLNGRCSPDFHDIWFTNTAGKHLPFWIESIANNAATVWLKADSIATGGTTFVLRYGDPLKGAESNGASVFSLFDDFSGDLSQWNTYGTSSISDGLLTLSGSDAAIDSKTTFGLGYAVRCLSKSVTTGQYCMPVQWRNLPESTYVRFLNMSSYEYYDTSSGNVSGVPQSTTFHVREIRKISSSSTVFYHDAATGLHTRSFDATNANRAGVRANGINVVADWILVRKVIATEPSLTSVGVESVEKMYG